MRVHPALRFLGILVALGVATPVAATVNVGDILTADLNGRVLKVNPATGAFTVLASGGFLVNPVGIAVESSGKIVVADVSAQGSAAIIRINPADGSQSLVTSGNLLNNPDGIAIDASGRLLVCDLINKSVVRVDPTTGAQTLVTQNGQLSTPTFLAVDTDGSILVVDPGAAAGAGAIIRVDPVTGAQSILSSGDKFVHPIDIVIDGCGRILVSDVAALTGAVFDINRTTGAQTVVSSGGLTGKARGIGLEPGGTILITAETEPLIVRIDQQGGRTQVAFDSGMGVPYGITTYHPGQPNGCYTFQPPPPPNHAPTLLSVHDVPSDQGGKVFLRWSRSDLDVPSQQVITGYRVWRRLPLEAAQRLEPTSRETKPDQMRTADGVFWESVAEVPAEFLSGYGYTAATTRDSLAESNPYTAFFVTALTYDSFTFYESNVDSGYSVDNLAPAQPTPFTAVYAPGVAHLHWGKNPESDFAQYRLYRGTTATFVPSPNNLVEASPDTGFVDATGGVFYYYKLSALDLHGNESRFALVSPNAPTAALASLSSAEYRNGAIELAWIADANPGLAATLYRSRAGQSWSAVATVSADDQGSIRYRDTDVERGQEYGYRLGILNGDHEVIAGEAWVTVPSLHLALTGARTNPISRLGFSVAFTLPSAEPATLEVFDAGGRLLVSREVSGLGAGDHEVSLPLRSSFSAGLVVVRLRQGGIELTSKAVVLP